MKNRVVLCKIFTVICLATWGLGYSAAAQEKSIKLKDVPDDHWAAAAVYDLVKMGVTKGYPDGTFRGNKPITRYETALFLSKLSQSVSGADAKADIQALRDELLAVKKANKQDFSVKGNYEGSGKFGNLLARSDERGGIASYRLIMNTEKNLADNANIKINMDTMDFGYNNDGTNTFPGNGLLATELLDIESNLRVGIGEQPVDLKVTFGPGSKQHAADPTRMFPSEIGVVYQRPSTGVMATTKLWGADLSGAARVVQSQPLDVSGKINSGWIRAGLGFNTAKLPVLNDLRVNLTGDYLTKGITNPTDKNLKAKVEVAAPITEKVQATAAVGLAHASSRMMVSGALALNDLLDTGTVLTIRAAKVGSQYVDQAFPVEKLDIVGYDNFDRPLENATVNVGGELVQTVSDRAKLIGKGDVRLSGDYKYQGPNARLTAQGGVQYNIAPNVNLDAAYRIYQDKGLGNTSDLAAIGLLYNF